MRQHIGVVFAACLIALCLPLSACSGQHTQQASAAHDTTSQSTKKKSPSSSTLNKSASPDTNDSSPAKKSNKLEPKTSDEILSEVNSLSPAAPQSAYDLETGYFNVPHSDMKSLYLGCSPQSVNPDFSWNIAQDSSWMRATGKGESLKSIHESDGGEGIPSYLLTQCLSNYAGMPTSAIATVQGSAMDGKWRNVTWDDHELLYNVTPTSYDWVLK